MKSFGIPCLVLGFSSILLAQAPLPPGTPKGPPGSIIIAPKPPGQPPVVPVPTVSPPPFATPAVQPATAKVIFETDPQRPGFLVVRPRGGLLQPSTSEALPPPQMGTPHLVIIRPQQGRNDPQIPPGQGGVPNAGAKPADPPADPKEGKILLETWDVATARGCKVAYFHVLVREVERDGKKLIYAIKEMKQQVARFGQAVETWAEDTTIETLDGQILATVSRQGIGKNQVLVITGEVAGKKLKIDIQGAAKNTKEIDWPEGVLGISREANLIKDKKLRPGESISYSSFDARLGVVVRYTATAAKVEEIAVGEGQKPRKLLPVKVEMAPIGDFKLPPGLCFYDPETYELVKTEQDMPPLGGLMTILRTTKEVALRPAARLLDLAEVQSIVLAKELPTAHSSHEIVYQFKLGGELPLEKAFTSDARQTLKALDVKARTFELHVSAVRTPPRPTAPLVKPGQEFLADSYFIDWNAEQVKAHAAAAVAGLPANASDWRKAQAVEAWVKKNMRATEFSQAMATCANVAKNLTGDCTEYAVLATGMCRALKIPARTAIGLVYAPPQRGSTSPTLAWHMWFEVWTEGGWMALDAVMGEGAIGPGHLKVADASWHEEKSFTPLLPLISLLGTSPKAEVIRVTPAR